MDGEAVRGYEEGEKGEDEGCWHSWCGSWFVMTGNAPMPWVAYYVF